MRYRHMVADHLKKCGAQLVHITGPSDVGMLGALVAHSAKLPIVASWHTNIHAFGGRRLAKMLSFLPPAIRTKTATLAEEKILDLSVLYYRVARILLAPNLELVGQLQQRTGRPTFLMQRGVDTVLFSPEKRDRCDRELVIGYVGRLSPEECSGFTRCRARVNGSGRGGIPFLIVGDGHERTWLQANLQRADFTGILTGEALSRAYANMDIFAFPSQTDTFGNGVLEALASGVPVVITSSGGPKYLVTHGVTGLVSADTPAFSQNIVALARDADMRHRMRIRARDFALCRYWHRIFEQIYDSYEYCLRTTRPVPRRETAPAIGRTPA